MNPSLPKKLRFTRSWSKAHLLLVVVCFTLGCAWFYFTIQFKCSWIVMISCLNFCFVILYINFKFMQFFFDVTTLLRRGCRIFKDLFISSMCASMFSMLVYGLRFSGRESLTKVILEWQSLGVNL